MAYLTNYLSPIGKLLLASDGQSLIGLWIEGQRYYADTLTGNIEENADDLPVFEETKTWLDNYFRGKNPGTHYLKLSPYGSEFRKRVWSILRTIPYGQVMTYGAIAKIIAAEDGKKIVSAQAVGGAIGRNPISIIIPCHRVVGSGGKLTGYAAGLETKDRLLKMEKSHKYSRIL